MTGLPATIPGEETFACHSCGRDTVVRDVKQPYIGGCILCGHLQDLPAVPTDLGRTTARRGTSSVSPRRAFSFSLGRVAALSGAVMRLPRRLTEAAPGWSFRSIISQVAGPARHVTFGDILAGLALVAFGYVVACWPEIIGWIGGAL